MRKYSFEDWYRIYSDEIEHIIDDYIEFIMSQFGAEHKYHSLNMDKFRTKMTHLLYNTSVNTDKSSIIWLP
jgi:hypothetical protein